MDKGEGQYICADSEMIPAVNVSSSGLDSLEEEEEKFRVFAQLETGVSSPIDYSELNRGLDSTNSTFGADLRRLGRAVEQDRGVPGDARASGAISTSSGSTRHSDGLEKEENAEEFLEKREGDSCLGEELAARLVQRERELQTIRDKAKDLSSLRQHNYLPPSKVHKHSQLRNPEEGSQKRRADVTDSTAQEWLQQIDKKIQEQEMLLKGYQQENERLYFHVKDLQNKQKTSEDTMIHGNQRPMEELTFTRQQLNKNSLSLGNVSPMDHTHHFTHLASVSKFQVNEAKLSEEIQKLRQEKQNLDMELQQTKKERDLARAQALSTQADRARQEERHTQEVGSLMKKLQWFAENQELLEKDGVRLQAAGAEILRLKEQIKDLEQILRHREPNSQHAQIYAAATAGDEEHTEASKTSPPSRTSVLLERRIQHLEAELEKHDEEAKGSLRALEQQFHSIKLCYEQQISELEQKLNVEGSTAATRPKTSRVQMLEKELQRLKESHQEKEKSLQDHIGSLQQQLKQKAHPSPGRLQLQTEEAFGLRIERLNRELGIKTRCIQELSRTVDRLQKERRNMLTGSHPRLETRSGNRRHPGSSKTACPAGETCVGQEMFPAVSSEKTYEPMFFTDTHISEVLRDNEVLKKRLEQLELQDEQDKEALRSEAFRAREELHRQQQHCEEQLSSLKAEHLRVLDQLHVTHALENSSSKVAELTNELHSQEIKAKYLQTQVDELRGTKDALEVSRTREDALQKQLIRLLTELKDVKEAQCPEVNLLSNLEKKLLSMEFSHQHRDRELQQVIQGSRQMLGDDQQSEVERWKRVAQDKTRELEAFRLELDSILDILRHLQRQRSWCT
ncbi:centrosomal protein of 162 kDa isoform X2 [Antennarius striatus]|uniref:centrosomal protein of 162 kDa isoform X2 n=1 Tax=Antennarius striatus TaxID=241820 RepID=UPI0035B3BB4D